MDYPDYTGMTLRQLRMIHDPAYMTRGNAVNARRFENGCPALAIIHSMVACLRSWKVDGEPVYHDELYGNDPVYRAVHDEQIAEWDAFRVTPEGRDYIKREARASRAGKRANRRKTFNPANADKPVSTRQYQTLVRFADKRYRLNLHDIDKLINRGEAHDALAVLLDKTGTLKRGVKKHLVEDLYARLDAWRKEQERASQTADELDDCAGEQASLSLHTDPDFLRAAEWIDDRFAEIFDNPDTAVEYDEPADLERVEPADGETLEQWTARIARDGYDPQAEHDETDEAFYRTLTPTHEGEEANP